jgi:hypothetical protein
MMRKGSLRAARAQRALTVVLGACGLPGVLARAQTPGEAAPPSSSFTFSLGLGGGFTSNPGFVSSTGESSGDSIANLRGDLAKRKTTPRTDWSARYGAFYTRYGSNGQLDSVNHALDFGGRYLPGRRSRVNVLEHFFYSRNPLQIETTDPTNEAVILTRQTDRWRSISDVSFDSLVSRTVTLQAGAMARIERFDLSPPLKIDSYAGRFGIKKQIGRTDSISSVYSYSRFAFHDENVPDTNVQGLDLGWGRGAPARTIWDLSAGVSRVARAGGGQGRFMAAASMHHAFRRLEFVSGYRRSIDADAGVATLTVAQNAYSGITVKVGERASMGLLGEYGTRDSVLEGGEQLALKYSGGAARFTVTVNPRLDLSGEARRRRQTVTAGAGDDLTVNSLLLNLVYRVF